MKTLVITNQKGGVGKTTTAMNLAAGLGIEGYKVLLMDLDPQSNTTTGMGINKDEIKVDIFDVLVKNKNVNDSIIKTKTKNVDVIPSSIALAGTEIYLSSRQSKQDQLFQKIIDKIETKYDYIIFDCPPSLGLINRNALSVAEQVIIPIQAEYYALEGLTQLLSTISLVKKMFNSDLQIGGILLTMFDPRTNLANEVEEEVKKFFKEKVFNTKIPRNVALAEAPSTGQTIFDYQISSKGAEAYKNLTKEILKI